MAASRPRAPRWHPGRTVHGGVAALALAVGLAACAGGDGSSSAADAADAAERGSAGAAVSAGADCLAPQVLDALGFAGGGGSSTAHPDVPAAGPVPDGFSAVSAVLCTTGETLTDAAGRWAAVTATRLEGDVRPLLTALTASSTVPASGTPPTPCAADAERADLWLVDALGAAVRVALPSGGCGPLPVSVSEGLEALDAVDVEHYPVELVGPRATASPTGS
ncbi:hypothetical protein MHY85_16350 [Cellulomonas sp. ACRRI]|uniref:hypothetical protein n=1 Tax=Cellulomonas sp. ACRRI TaxID=2918188 RepID=UPI001EF2D7D0|nr:hypothetical protein [Cellulomonas sp. ACRRI]MCG7287539.1 hypothetical protein [Cellulomonas sp. ACRRI]